MSGEVAAVFATVLTFMFGVVFYAGKLAARVDSLETWRMMVVADQSEIKALRKEIADMRQVAG